jgi:hypothetical protein
VDTWNSFAGVAPFDEMKPVKKFTNRKAAVARVWQAVTRLSPDAAQPAADVAPAKGKGKKAPAKAPRRAPAQKSATESRSNKKADVIALMKRAKGVTLAEIAEATGWQKHTVRGFVSILGSKGGQKIESSKNAAGERTRTRTSRFRSIVTLCQPILARRQRSGMIQWQTLSRTQDGNVFHREPLALHDELAPHSTRVSLPRQSPATLILSSLTCAVCRVGCPFLRPCPLSPWLARRCASGAQRSRSVCWRRPIFAESPSSGRFHLRLTPEHVDAESRSPATSALRL